MNEVSPSPFTKSQTIAGMGLSSPPPIGSPNGHLVLPGSQCGPIPGMESVVASVTGYVGNERLNLVKLINGSGGFYVGNLWKTTTHLVCWKFEGKKYMRARKWGTIVVNHRWFEDCLQARRRLPESPYTILCGEAVGPLLWKEPEVRLISAPHANANGFQEDKNGAAHSQFEKLELRKKNPIFHWPPHQPRQAELSNLGLDSSDKLLVVEDQQGAGQSRSPRGSDARTQQQSMEKDCVKQERIGRSIRENAKVYCIERSLGAEDKAQDDENQTGSMFLETISVKRLNVPSFDDNLHIEKAHFSESLIDERDNGENISVFEEVNINAITPRKRAQPRIDNGRSGKPRRLMKKKASCSILNFVSVLNDNSSNEPVLQTDKDMPAKLSEATCSRICVEDEASSAKVLCGRDSMQSAMCVGLEDCIPFSSSATTMGAGTSHAASQIPLGEIACVICHAEKVSSAEGVLICGHRFCFNCINQWAAEAVSKAPTCPLCKAPFDMITRRERTDGSDEFVICSQSSPRHYMETIVMVAHEKGLNLDHLPVTVNTACIMCGNRDMEELLLNCSGCGQRFAHTFCLDPPLPPVPDTPWFCGRCTQRRRPDTMWWYHLYEARPD